ncbi:MAG: hypothetical protein ACLTDS_14120 [Bianqueaceae bacterium]
MRRGLVEEAKFSGEGNRKHGRAAKEERTVRYFSGRRNMRQAWTREGWQNLAAERAENMAEPQKKREPSNI